MNVPHTQTRSPSIMLAPSLTARSSTRAGIGSSSLPVHARIANHIPVLAQWDAIRDRDRRGQGDQGLGRRCVSLTSYSVRSPCLIAPPSLHLILSGVPQLSLGEKAVLTATPDYVSLRSMYAPRLLASSSLLFSSRPFYSGFVFPSSPPFPTSLMDADADCASAPYLNPLNPNP